MNIKAVILAGGLGSRISEETHLKPKPMIEIGGKPILWHIMKIYSHWGINDFVICCGYKGYVVKEYFSNYFLHTSDVTFDLVKQTTEIHENASEPWRITLIDTGENTNTGGRLRQVARYLNNERFCLTYGDGVANINIPALLNFHESKKSMITLTVAQPPGRFGSVSLNDNDYVEEFIEKPQGDGGWVNAGFMVVEPGFIDKYTSSDQSSLEHEGLHTAASDRQLAAFRHPGFWQAMDTLRDHTYLNTLWSQGNAPWKLWDGQSPQSKQSGTMSDWRSFSSSYAKVP
jgi:glucose-1-phosphate cytidylyltransferase